MDFGICGVPGASPPQVPRSDNYETQGPGELPVVGDGRERKGSSGPHSFIRSLTHAFKS